MSLKNLIKEAKAVNELGAKDLVASTIRIPKDLYAYIEDLADILSLTKQDMMLKLLEEGAKIAESELEGQSENEEQEIGNCFIFNTVRRYGVWHESFMLNNKVVAAWNEKKSTINSIKENDLIFLYRNSTGILAYGYATGRILEDEDNNGLYQELKDFSVLETPLPARRIKEILGRDIVLLRTKTRVKDGQAILNVILAQK